MCVTYLILHWQDVHVVLAQVHADDWRVWVCPAGASTCHTFVVVCILPFKRQDPAGLHG